MAMRLVFVILFLLGTVVSACSPGPDNRPIPEGPNVLLLTIDTLRADHVGCQGGTGGHTPRIDAFASKSLVFDHCAAPIATTCPSHATMLTGLYPRFHGVRWNGHSLDEEFETLSEICGAKGWDTAAFVAFKSMLTRAGLNQGFLTVSDKKKVKGASRIRSGAEVNLLVKEWLSTRESKRPFFLWVHYYEPHGPYPMTPYAEETMAKAGYTGPYADGADMDELMEISVRDPADRAAVQALYAGRVREADRLTGELLDMLDEGKLDSNTVVILTGDHGQMMGELIRNRPSYGHGPMLWEGVLHVPFVLHDPASPEVGHQSDRIGLVDIMPTLLDRLGIDRPSSCQGRSLLPALKGQALKTRPYVSEIRVPPPKEGEDPAGHYRDRVAVYHEEMKVLFPEKSVFDLTRENPEESPLPADSHKELINKLNTVANYFLTYKEERSRSSDLNEDDLDELRELGYLK